MSLFIAGNFVLHSGARSKYKIDCDALTDEDWRTAARVVAGYMTFGSVIGIPRGGLRFASALREHADPISRTILLCDDVFTTGKSMEDMRARLEWLGHGRGFLGVVLFARSRCPEWIRPLFMASEMFAD